MHVAQQSFNKEKLLDEAEAWIAKLRSDEIVFEDKQAFSAWLNTSEDHVKAFDKAYTTWQTLGAVVFLPNLDAVDERAQRPGFLATFPQIVKPHWLDRLHPWQSGLAFICVLALFTITLHVLEPQSRVTPERYSTSIGEVRSIVLADGSAVELNTQSSIDVTYTDEVRLLTLLTGEAYFSVAKDYQRPFIVDFGRGTATAIGTAFNIYRQPIVSSVTVIEGIVDVREAPDLAVPEPNANHVHKNQQVKVGMRGVTPIRNLDSSRTVAWRDKTIVFNDTPLSTALAELSRYLDRSVKVANSDLDNLKVSGTFSLSSPDETVEALATAFKLVKSESSTDNTLYLGAE